MDTKLYNRRGSWLVVDEDWKVYSRARLRLQALRELKRLRKDYPEKNLGITWDHRKLGKHSRSNEKVKERLSMGARIEDLEEKRDRWVY